MLFRSQYTEVPQAGKVRLGGRLIVKKAASEADAARHKPSGVGSRNRQKQTHSLDLEEDFGGGGGGGTQGRGEVNMLDRGRGGRVLVARWTGVNNGAQWPQIKGVPYRSVAIFSPVPPFSRPSPVLLTR